MPISEDEYEPRSNNTYEATSTMSKAELRKTHKPIMEKRRRARINHCLNEIKTLILDAMKKDPARHSKLEKADILEMAVKHLQNVQRQQLALAMATDPSVLRKFKAGFNECADEVNRYITNLDGLDPNLQQRISQHLSKCISGIEQIVHLNFPGFGGVPFLAATTSALFSSSAGSAEGVPEPAPGDQNNNPPSSIQIPANLQLIPSRLPTGEIALLLPNSSGLSYFPNVASPGAQGTPQQETGAGKPGSRPSAFVTVIPSSFNSGAKSPPSNPPKPLLSPPQSPSSSSNPSHLPLEENPRKTPSPHGFRPVNPSSQQRIQIGPLYGQQGCSSSADPSGLVSSTSAERRVASPPRQAMGAQSELKTMRFPIQKYSSPQKLAEPLSIITNHAERFRHGQVLEETANYEENVLQRGVKRKSEYGQTGLLAVASPNSKIPKTYRDSSVADYKINVGGGKVPEVVMQEVAGASRGFQFQQEVEERGSRFEGVEQGPSTSRREGGGAEGGGDTMWRPW